jgi:hypothetical protein
MGDLTADFLPIHCPEWYEERDRRIRRSWDQPRSHDTKVREAFKDLRRNDDRFSFRAASGIASCGYDSAHSLDGGTDGINIGSCVLTIRTLACEVASR